MRFVLGIACLIATTGLCRGGGIDLPSALVQSRNVSGLGYRYETRSVSMGGGDLFLRQNLFTIHGYYVPVPPLLFGLGIGIGGVILDDNSETRGRLDAGLSPELQISLRTPGILRNLLRAAGNVETGVLLMYPGEESIRTYAGWEVFPSGGIIFSPVPVLDWEIGAGAMIAGSYVEDSSRKTATYSGDDLIRVFSSLSLHSSENGAFLNVRATVSPTSEFELRGAPVDASISCELGFVMRGDAQTDLLSKRIERVFPEAEQTRAESRAMEKSVASRMKKKTPLPE